MPTSANSFYFLDKFSTAQAAEIAECTQSYIRELIYTERLEAVLVANRWFIAKNSFFDYLRKPKHRGRPRKN